ncbi:hypothetical protein F4802DRAFT_614993 [Xylaria palmicola]|nr:hypothetical protein F4802DRAFT_614993 [Xylaria palmicola]
MQFLRDRFKVGRCPIVETDEVYPLYFLDNLAAGRDSVLSETLRYNHVLDGVGTDKDDTVPYLLDGNEIKGWGFVRLALGMLWDIFRHPQPESRAICLPREFLSRLRETCLKELQAVRGGEGNALFLSEGDVLGAWGSRFGSHGVYVQNTARCVYTSIDPDVLLRRPLGELAHVIRRSIHASATDEQIRAQLRIFRTLGHTKRLPLFRHPDAHLMSFSNWTKFGIFDVADFSPAILPTPSSTVSGNTPAGKPAYMHCQALGENRFLRNCFNITGKDWGGNYWITAFLYPEDWAKLEGYMEKTCQHIKEPKM